MLIEVPDRVRDALGTRYSVAEVCPYFYLNGIETGEAVKPAARRMSRDAKIAELGKLRDAALLIAGYTDSLALRQILDDIEACNTALRLIVVTGWPDTTGNDPSQLISGRPTEFAAAIRFTALDVHTVIRECAARRRPVEAAPSIRVGKASVPLAPLLRREPPIDSDFAIVTEADLRAPEPAEATEALSDLISGRRIPWRAFSGHLAWTRSRAHLSQFDELLASAKRGEHDVIEVDLPAEAGSGLSTLLQHFAFRAGLEGCPALIYRGSGPLNYDRLRSFLTDLAQGDTGFAGQRIISVVLFDASAVAMDSMSLLYDLPARLARDGRRAIVVRGVRVRHADRQSGAFGSRDRKMRRTHHVQMPRLAAELSTTEQDDLVHWVNGTPKLTGEQLRPATSSLIHRWTQVSQVPLLICLYFILRDEFAEARHLGMVLVRRAVQAVDQQEAPVSLPDPDRKLTAAEIRNAVARLATHKPATGQPTKSELAQALLVLSAAGTLSATMPRDVLADLCGIPARRTLDVITVLVREDLAEMTAGAGGEELRLAPSAFYVDDGGVALRHSSYGRLVIEWLATKPGQPHCQQLGIVADSLCGRILLGAQSYQSKGDVRLPEYPIQLFKPVLRALRPLPHHVRFAEEFCSSYLRFQKTKDRPGCPGLAYWQQSHLDELVEAFGWLDSQVVHQSASLLHSRAITVYKSCKESLPIAEQRLRYQRAVVDLKAALELSRDDGGEHPGNIITSLGLLYLGWAVHERSAGCLQEWAELDTRVEETLRSAKRERADNPFAAFGLAKYLVDRVRRSLAPTSPEGDSTQAPPRIAEDLSEAIELLSGEPEPQFEDEWHELHGQAVGLLSGPEVKKVICELQRLKRDLGYSLEALQILQGAIPGEPTQNPADVTRIRNAAAVLQAAEQAGVRPEPLGNLLRYAVFTSDPDRVASPRYAERYARIETLRDTLYLEQPVWLYDFAMLSFQVAKFDQGVEAFARLRRGKRFFEVPRERSCFLSESPETKTARIVSIRVVSGDDGEGKGWCRVEPPLRIKDPIPFSVRSFRSRAKAHTVGAVTTANIALNPAGPYAEPESR